MAEDKLQSTRGISNVELTRTWDAEHYKRKALERADRAALSKSTFQSRKDEDGKEKEEGFLQQRQEKIEFSIGRQTAVQDGKAGYLCQVCERRFFDSAGYLSHLNSVEHQTRIGNSMAVKRSTLEEVKQALRDKIQEKYGLKKTEDTRTFEERVRDAQEREKEQAELRAARKQARKAEREQRERESEQQEDQDVMQAMGFGNFGSSKKRNR